MGAVATPPATSMTRTPVNNRGVSETTPEGGAMAATGNVKTSNKKTEDDSLDKTIRT
jgi:hypothetical protein